MSSTRQSHAFEVVRVLVAGSTFGAALTLSRVYLPDVILNQMRLKDFHMLEVFLSATSLSAIVIASLRKLSIIDPVTRSNSKLAISSSKYDGNILGGALIGLGMALSGACPGTVIIQLAQGIPSARITTVGAIVGGIVWALIGDRVTGTNKTISQVATTSEHQTQMTPTSADLKSDSKVTGNSTKSTSSATAISKPYKSRQTISEAFNLNATFTFLSFITFTFSTVLISSFLLPGKTETIIPTYVCGSLIATAQFSSLILTQTPLGTSAAYEQIGQYLTYYPLSLVGGSTNVKLPSFPPKSILFAAGMMAGSQGATRYEENILSILSNVMGKAGLEGETASALSSLSTLKTLLSSLSEMKGSMVHSKIPVLQALVGGFVLSFGARMAGGCTSGHGISGLSALSFASLISVVSMFGAGIGARMMLDSIIGSAI